MKRILSALLFAAALQAAFSQIRLEGLDFGDFTSPVRHYVASPVLVKFSNGGSGSGFYVRSTNRWFLATARHVLFDNSGNLRGTNVVLTSQSQGLTNTCTVGADLGALMAHGLVRPHRKHDVAVVQLGEFPETNRIHYNKAWLNITNGGNLWCIDASALRVLADVKVGDDAYVFGYASSIGLQVSPKFDYSKPLLRKGVIAGVYDKERTIIVDSSVYFGNSGGPVLEIEQTKFNQWKFGIIGVVSEMIPFVETWENKSFGYANAHLSNSGYCVVEPVDFILELLGN